MMKSLLELDDAALDLICSYLEADELFRLSLVSKSLQTFVSSRSMISLTHSSIDVSQLPIPTTLLQMAVEVNEPAYRTVPYERFIQNRIARVSSCLPWLTVLNTKSLRTLILDGTRVNALHMRDLFVPQLCPQLQYLSIRFCQGIYAGMLLMFLDDLASKGTPITLRRLDAAGIQGLPFFGPEDHDSVFVTSLPPQLIGSEYRDDTAQWWSDAMDQFEPLLRLVPTTHGEPISTDVVTCKQAFCNSHEFRNTPDLRRELIDSTAPRTHPPCLVCGLEKIWRACRHCTGQRHCATCGAFVCTDCLPSISFSSLWFMSEEKKRICLDYLEDFHLDCHATWRRLQSADLTDEITSHDAMWLIATHRVMDDQKPALDLNRCFALAG